MDKESTVDYLFYQIRASLFGVYASKLQEGFTTEQLANKINLSSTEFKVLLEITPNPDMSTIANLCYAMNIHPRITLYNNPDKKRDDILEDNSPLSIEDIISELTMHELKYESHDENRKKSLHMAIESLKSIQDKEEIIIEIE